MIASLTLSAINRCLDEYINEVHDADYELALLTGDIVLRNVVQCYVYPIDK